MTEQDKFEQWYALVHCKENGFNVSIEEIKEYRKGDDYGDYRYLNGCWEGWQGKARYTGLTEMGFILRVLTKASWLRMTMPARKPMRHSRV